MVLRACAARLSSDGRGVVVATAVHGRARLGGGFELSQPCKGRVPQRRGVVGNRALAGACDLWDPAIERRDELLELRDDCHGRNVLTRFVCLRRTAIVRVLRLPAVPCCTWRDAQPSSRPSTSTLSVRRKISLSSIFKSREHFVATRGAFVERFEQG